MRLFKPRLMTQYHRRKAGRRWRDQLRTTRLQSVETFANHLDQLFVIQIARRGEDEIVRPVDFVIPGLNIRALECRERIFGAEDRATKRVTLIKVLTENVEDDVVGSVFDHLDLF